MEENYIVSIRMKQENIARNNQKDWGFRVLSNTGSVHNAMGMNIHHVLLFP